MKKPYQSQTQTQTTKVNKKCRTERNHLDRSTPVAFELDYKDVYQQLAPLTTVLTIPKGAHSSIKVPTVIKSNHPI